MTKDKIIRKIQAAKKLAAVGTGGEAENAARAVARLMAQHAITQADLDAGERQAVDMGRTAVKCAAVGWERKLFFAICKFSSVFAAKTSSHMYLYGDLQDRVIAEYTFEAAKQQIKSGWAVYAAELKQEYLDEVGELPERSYMFTCGKQYRDSAVQGFNKYLKEQRRRAEREADVQSRNGRGSTALILSTRYDLAESWARSRVSFRKGAPSKSYTHSARGYADGKKIRVNRGIAGGDRKRLS